MTRRFLNERGCGSMGNNRYRPDQDGKHRAQFDRNKRRIFATQKNCAICGGEVDFSLKYPDPYSATIDHIVPLHKGGHPSSLENLQLAHLRCNRLKSDKVQGGSGQAVETNRNLPQSMDWTAYRA